MLATDDRPALGLDDRPVKLGSRLVAVALVTSALAACGQKPGVLIAAAGNAGATELAAPGPIPAPPECAGDVDHCHVLTTYRGVHVYASTGPHGFCTVERRCRYPANQYGSRWQCVELVNRFLARRFGIAPIPGHARELLANAPAVDGVAVHLPGGPARPVPGDILVFDSHRYGHAAIITAVTDRWLHVVEQNGHPDGVNRYGYDAAANLVVSDPSSALVPLGWIHASPNDAATAGGSAPDPDA